MLITDPYTPQAYDVMLGMRQECEAIIVLLPKFGRFTRIFCSAANSRLVTRIHVLKNQCTASTEDIAFDRAEGDKVRCYIDEILAVCARENVDLVYPTSDREVLLLSKYAEEFIKRNVLLPVNKFDVLCEVMDKLKVIELARQACIPVPETMIARESILKEKNTAWFLRRRIIKPRFSDASRGLTFINSRDDFQNWLCCHKNRVERFVLQDFIPGDTILYYRVYMKADGDVFWTSCVRCCRPEMMLHQGRGLFLELSQAPVFSERIIELFRRQKYIGYGHVQFKIDQNTQEPKFMELNARISRGTWSEMRQGMNAPMVSLALLSAQTPPSMAIKEEKNMCFAWPLQDFCIFFSYLLFSLIRRLVSSKNTGTQHQPPLKTMFQHYRKIYFGSERKKEPDNYSRNLFWDGGCSGAYFLAFIYNIMVDFKHSFLSEKPSDSALCHGNKGIPVIRGNHE